MGIEKAMAEPDCAMIKRDQGEGAESPENKSVREAREWALADNFCLAHDFPNEVHEAAADGKKVEAGVFFRLQDLMQDGAEAAPEKQGRGDDKSSKKKLLREGEVRRFRKS